MGLYEQIRLYIAIVDDTTKPNQPLETFFTEIVEKH